MRIHPVCDQIRSEAVSCQAYSYGVRKTARKFRSFSEAEKADRDFYKKLTGNERLQILVDFSIMTLSKDWREFLELLNSRGVDLADAH